MAETESDHPRASRKSGAADGHITRQPMLNVCRFCSQYPSKNLPLTPYEALHRCHQIARARGLEYVSVGNLPHSAQSTSCPKRGKLLIGREGYRVEETHIKDGQCEFCQHPISGIWP